MLFAVVMVVLAVGILGAIRLAGVRAKRQKLEHDARLRAMAQVHLAAAKKAAAAKQAALAAAASEPATISAPRDERECPFCAELILKKARICKHCGREVPPIA